MTDVFVREATPRDAESFLRLRVVYWDRTFRALGGGANADRYLRFEKASTWEAMIEDGYGVLAERGEVVGAGLLVRCYGEPYEGVAPVDPSRFEALIYVVPTIAEPASARGWPTGWSGARRRKAPSGSGSTCTSPSARSSSAAGIDGSPDAPSWAEFLPRGTGRRLWASESAHFFGAD